MPLTAILLPRARKSHASLITLNATITPVNCQNSQNIESIICLHQRGRGGRGPPSTSSRCPDTLRSPYPHAEGSARYLGRDDNRGRVGTFPTVGRCGAFPSAKSVCPTYSC